MSHDDQSAGPIDIGAVRRDDQFLADLAAGRAADIHDRTEHELAGLMAQWRADTLTGPMPSTPTVADVEAAIARTNNRERRGGLSRRLRIVSGAAAVLAVVGAGVLVLSEGSQPGDPLWSVKQVVFADQAEQTQARVDAQDNISEARKALAAGDTAKASALISKAEDDIGPIRDTGEANALRDLIEKIKKQDLRKLIPSLPALPIPQSPTVTDTEKEPAPTAPAGSPTESPTQPTEPSSPATQPPSTTSTTVTENPPSTPTSTSATASATKTLSASASKTLSSSIAR